MADTPTPTAQATNANSTPAEPDLGQSLYDLADSILSSNTGKGAAMGGLLGYLLNQYSNPGGVNLGVDMSKVSGIAPRTTTLPRSNYVSYSDYGVQNQAPAMTSQMARDFGISGGLSSRLPVSSYSALPARQNLAPVSFTSAGTGTGKLLNPTVTPRSNNKISPLTGALMGSAIGYLMPSSSGGTSGSGGGSGGASGGSGGSGGNLWTNVLNAAIKKFGSSNTPNTSVGNNQTTNPNDSNYSPPTNSSNNPNSGSGYWGNIKPTVPVDDGDSSYYPITNPSNNNNTNNGSGYYTPYNPTFDDDSTGGTYWSAAQTFPTGNLTDNSATVDYYNLDKPMSNWTASTDYKDGGMATPMMADGGQVPHYYTYGTAIDPQQIMQNMAQGGKPQAHGGLHVPTVEGRHDYRSGSRVTGEGDGQSDDIPAMLADGEYVFDADTVAQLGNGSTKAGSDLLDRFREEIRSHKRSAPVNKIPPPAKSPLAYLKAARSKKNG